MVDCGTKPEVENWVVADARLPTAVEEELRTPAEGLLVPRPPEAVDDKMGPPAVAEEETAPPAKVVDEDVGTPIRVVEDTAPPPEIVEDGVNVPVVVIPMVPMVVAPTPVDMDVEDPTPPI